MALAYRRYGGAIYDAEERRAMAARAGLWASEFIFPWQWRRLQKVK
jgi:endonuclease YncB( thermonuclease family)